MLELKVLRGLDILEHSDVIALFTTMQTFDAGKPVVLKGDPGTALFIVLSGEVKIRLGELEVTFAPGDFLGEVAFLDGKPRSAKIMATQDGTLIASLSRQQMDVIIATKPQLAICILQNIGIEQAQRLRNINEAYVSLSARTRAALAKKVPWLASVLPSLFA